MHLKIPSVLIVEDNRAMAQVLRFNFERAGFETGIAYDGLDAVQQLQAKSFDMVITDFQMPIMDGAELCHHIRHELHLMELPIILCSAKGMEVDAGRLVVSGGTNSLLERTGLAPRV